MSIKKSLRISLILVTCTPLVLMTILTYVLSYNKYIELSQSSASSLAQTYAEGFQSQLEGQMAELEVLASVSSIANLTLESYNGLALGSDSVYYEPVTTLLATTSSHMDNNIQFYIYDINGYYIAGSNNENTGDWSEYMDIPITEIKDTSILKSSNINLEGKSIDIITPIIVKKTIVGLIRSEINSDYFGSFMTDKNNSFVVTSNGDYLFSAEGFSNNPALEEELISLFDSEKANGFLENSSHSVEKIYGYAKLPDYDWIYVIQQSGDQYKEVLSPFPYIVVITLVIIVVISIRISNLLTQKYTSPIYALKENMEEAADGNFNVACNITSNDEFEDLSKSFNTMMEIIATNYEELDRSKKVLEANEEELKTNYRHIEQLAYHDGLTGLYNRIAFMKYSREIFHEDGAQFTKHAIFFIDLDNFKNVNDTLGHDYGDMLLKQVSAKLSSFTRENDILARTGGDEFLIFKSNYSTNEELEEYAESLIGIVHNPFDLDGEIAHVSMSVGIARFPDDGLSISELIKNADIAMYDAKTSGKNGYKFFNSYMEDDFNKKNELSDVLGSVIENNEIYLEYQPQVNVASGKITGYEALMRIESDVIGFVPPSEFIPISEDNGTINQLGEWALYHACEFNQNLIKGGYEPIRVSVNISTAQLKDNKLISIIKSIPEKTGMDLKYLEIEITESVLMDSFEHNLDLINQIKALGATIALDDFGTGYSSFNYLTKIPIDTLKIDKSFIQGICNSEKDRYIADSIISLAHKMKISVVAEGVEDIEQLKILQNQFCDTLQGYLFSKPLSALDFIELLKENQKS